MIDPIDQRCRRKNTSIPKPAPPPPVPEDQRFEDMYQASLARLDSMARPNHPHENRQPCPNFPSSLRFIFPRHTGQNIPTSTSTKEADTPRLQPPIRLRDYFTSPRLSRPRATHAHSAAVDLRHLPTSDYDADSSSDSGDESDSVTLSPSPSHNRMSRPLLRRRNISESPSHSQYSARLHAQRERSASPRSRLTGLSAAGPNLTPPRPLRQRDISTPPVTPKRPNVFVGNRFPGTHIRERILGRSPRHRGLRIAISPPDSPIRSLSASPTPPPPSPPPLGFDAEYDDLFRERMETLFGEQYNTELGGPNTPLHPGIDQDYDLLMIHGLRKLFNQPNWTPSWLESHVYPSFSQLTQSN